MNDKEITYYILDKDLPGHKAGSVVSKAGTPGEDEYLFCGPFNFPIDYPEKHPGWFSPVTLEDHRAAFKSGFMEYGKSIGKTEAQAERAWEIFNSDEGR